MKFKKSIALLAVLTLLCTTVACGNSSAVSQGSISETAGETQASTISETSPEAVKLENHMTETERSRTSVHDLTLLDESMHTVSIELWTVEEYRQEILEPDRSNYTDEEYESMLHELEEREENGDSITYAVLIDGYLYTGLKPDINYDGGEIVMYRIDEAETQETLHFDNLDAYLAFLKEDLEQQEEKYELWDDYAENSYQETVVVFDAVMNGTYEILEKGTVDLTDDSIFGDSLGDYRTEWEFDREAVTEIKDSIQEISIYDEELDTEFLVHVTLPPDYDASKMYPMFVFSDGVWRFGNCPELRKLMENGEIQDVILVTLGYDYQIDGTNMAVRSKYFYENRDKTLDFMTDNLAPYLSELYNIDFAHSGFYGHSAGGVMSHYAVFHSDLYENQPFQYYIIGSPALWQLHRVDGEQYPDAGITDYGYWDRHDTLDKSVFLCGGENEDPDYEEYYDNYDTTLEGIAHLKERLENHGADVQCKIYEDSGHWQFIPDMFVEFFKMYYAC